jgi:hypothetical protein
VAGKIQYDDDYQLSRLIYLVSLTGRIFYVYKTRQFNDWGKNLKKQNKRKQIIILEARTF